MALRPLTTSLSCPYALIPQSIISNQHWDITDIRYSVEAHLYCSPQPSIFFHILLNANVNNYF